MSEEEIIVAAEDAATPVVEVRDEPNEEPVFEVTGGVIEGLFKDVQARRREIWPAAKLDLSVVAERQRKFALELVCNAITQEGYLLLHKAYASLMEFHPAFVRASKKGQYIRFDKLNLPF